MDPQTVVRIAELLKVYGGWGTTVLLAAGMVWEFKYFMALLEKRHVQISELLSESNTVLSQSRDTNREVKAELERLRNMMERRA